METRKTSAVLAKNAGTAAIKSTYQYIKYMLAGDKRESGIVFESEAGETIELAPEKKPIRHHEVNNEVRRFSSASPLPQLSLIVKSPSAPIWVTTEGYRRLKADIEMEMTFFRIAYPTLMPYVIEKWQKKTSEREEFQFTYRLMLPDLKGEQLNNYIHSHRSFREITYTFLVAAEELQRIHDLNIIHGDIKDDNILISTDYKDGEERYGLPAIKAHLIDFETSAFFGDDITTTKECCYWPPERVVESYEVSVFALPKQDIYSFAWMMQKQLDRNIRPRNQMDLSEMPLLDSLEALLDQAMDTNPNHRPTLENIINELKSTLSAIEKLRQPDVAAISRATTRCI